MTRRERWYHSAHVTFALVSLVMAIVLILSVTEAIRIRSDVVQLQQRAELLRERADGTLANVVAACNRGNSLRIAITYLLNQIPDAETIRLLNDPNLDPVECLSIYPKETP